MSTLLQTMARVMYKGKLIDTSKKPLPRFTSVVRKGAVKKVRKAAAKKVRSKSNDVVKKRTTSHNHNTKINQWNEENMKMAIEECNRPGSNVTVRAAARAWGIPKSKLN